MLDNTALSQAIETLASETEANSISPEYLAAVLRKINSLISTVYNSIPSGSGSGTTTVDNSIYTPVCTLAELDNLCSIDCVKADGRATYFVTAAIGTLTLVVGRCELFTDSMHHQITQVLTTHFIVDTDGTISGSAHNDYNVYTYYRSYGLTSGRPNYQAWSAWARQDYATQETLTTLQTTVTGIHFMGWFTSFSAAYDAAATLDICAPKKMLKQICFGVNSQGKEKLPTSPDGSSIYGSGYIYQHFYKDNNTKWKVWQIMPCDGWSGKKYKRLIIVDDGQTTVESVEDWAEY